MVISDHVGLRKPDPASYLLAAAGIGVPPACCVFTDDTAANLPAARDLGMTAVHSQDTASAIAAIGDLLGIDDRLRPVG